MNNNNQAVVNPRRKFLQTLATGAATVGLATAVSPFQKLKANPLTDVAENNNEYETWFKQLKGKHKLVFDVTEPHEIFPFAWPKVFSITNVATGSAEKDVNAVVVLRHNAIPYALPDPTWSKYKLGEVFHINDPKTNKPSLRNPFWKPSPGDFMVPGIGEVALGINDLQSSGIMFCVCNMAITVYSSLIADQMKMSAEDIKKDWLANLLPGIPAMPSGVWALGRAQEHGCGYCFVR